MEWVQTGQHGAHFGAPALSAAVAVGTDSLVACEGNKRPCTGVSSG